MIFTFSSGGKGVCGMVWTDLTAMVYIVPFIIVALVVLFIADFLGLASLADIHCPVCNKNFADVFGLRKHIKDVEKGKEKESPTTA
jgi:hypothetical protein